MNDLFFFIVLIAIGATVFVISQMLVILYLLKVVREQDERLEYLEPPF